MIFSNGPLVKKLAMLVTKLPAVKPPSAPVSAINSSATAPILPILTLFVKSSMLLRILSIMVGKLSNISLALPIKLSKLL